MRGREWGVGCGGVYGSRVGATPLPLQSDDDDDGDDGDVDGREEEEEEEGRGGGREGGREGGGVDEKEEGDEGGGGRSGRGEEGGRGEGGERLNSILRATVSVLCWGASCRTNIDAPPPLAVCTDKYTGIKQISMDRCMNGGRVEVIPV